MVEGKKRENREVDGEDREQRNSWGVRSSGNGGEKRHVLPLHSDRGEPSV